MTMKDESDKNKMSDSETLRLDDIMMWLGKKVYPWHGDVSAKMKSHP